MLSGGKAAPEKLSCSKDILSHTVCVTGEDKISVGVLEQKKQAESYKTKQVHFPENSSQGFKL